VRLILSGFATAARWSNCRRRASTANLIRIQNNLHNKGFVVDRRWCRGQPKLFAAPAVPLIPDASFGIFKPNRAIMGIPYFSA